jgi:disulfide bond formation protein DsbB
VTAALALKLASMRGAMSPLRAALRAWPVCALIVSALMLAIAHAFQSFGGLEPCHLCLKQREAYWAAMGVSGVAILAARLRPHPLAPRIASLVLAGVFAYGVYIAVWQAGAEWRWWPAPATCASTGRTVTMADIRALLQGKATAEPACDKASWVFLGLSMAGWNALISAALVVLSLAAALVRAPAAREAAPGAA